MADFYTYFSFTVQFPEATRVWALQLHQLMRNLSVGRNPEDLAGKYPPEMMSVAKDFLSKTENNVGFDMEEEAPELWFVSSESGVPSSAADFVQILMRKFEIDEPIHFEWSDDCSDSRVNAFGGGAMFITRDNIEMLTTRDWVNEKMSTFLKKEQPTLLSAAQEVRKYFSSKEDIKNMPLPVLERFLNCLAEEEHAFEQQEYVGSGGNICPLCQSNDIEGDSWNADSNYATQEVGCTNCGSSWNGLYTLTGFTDFVAGQIEEGDDE